MISEYFMTRASGLIGISIEAENPRLALKANRRLIEYMRVILGTLSFHRRNNGRPRYSA